MKFIALLMVTILLGAIGMEEIKKTYSQPDRDEHLMTKEIITGVLAQNILSDTTNGIPMFEKYNFPFDVRKTGDVSVYETSGGNAYFETAEKMKERIYQPVFAQAGSENLVRLTYKPNVRNLRQAPKYRITPTSIPMGEGIYKVDGIPSDARINVESYYWDGELEAFALFDFRHLDKGIYGDPSTARITCYLMDKNAKIVKTRSFDYPTNSNYVVASLGGNMSDYETNIYTVGHISDGSNEPYTDENGTFIIPENVGVDINPRFAIVKFDLKSGATSIVHESPKRDGESPKLFFTERYMVIKTKDRLVVFDKKYDKAHTIMGVTSRNSMVVNPVLRSITFSLGNQTWDIYTWDDNGIKQIASKTKDENKYLKYIARWIGNLDYDYIITTNSDVSYENQAKIAKLGGRGHYQLNFGNTDYDNTFFYTRNGVRDTYSTKKRELIFRHSNIDDGDILTGFNDSDGYDYYSPDRKNFLPFVDVLEYIRLWRKENAVLGVSMDSSTDTTYGLFWHD